MNDGVGIELGDGVIVSFVEVCLFLSFEGKFLEVDTLIHYPLFSEDAELLG